MSNSAFSSWERRVVWPDVPERVEDCESCHAPYPVGELDGDGTCDDCRDE